MTLSLQNLPFQIATASVRGQEHRRVDRNNQDAWACRVLNLPPIPETEAFQPECSDPVGVHRVVDRGLIAVVCDGCGSAPYSEVGAQWGAQLVVQTVELRMVEALQGKGLAAVDHEYLLATEQFWQRVYQDLLVQLQVVAEMMGRNWQQVLWDYFLFTIAGCLITPEITCCFVLGDGVLVLNGQRILDKSYAGNAPPYLAYGLSSSGWSAPELQFRLHPPLPTGQLNTVLVGTDGVEDLMAAASKPRPGQSHLVGTLEQFWQDDRIFTNPDGLRRQLALINREVITPDWQNRRLIKEPGLLPDDTTLILIRRQPDQESQP